MKIEILKQSLSLSLAHTILGMGTCINIVYPLKI